MNPVFKQFEEFITKAHTNGTALDSKEGRALQEICRYHATHNTSGEPGKENIVAVHIYHHELGWLGWDEVDLDTEGNKIPQVNNLERLIRTADRTRFKRVLFETFLNYAQKSHQFVDEGLIDNVIFTANNEGTPLIENDLAIFYRTKANYVGGTYGYECVREAISQIRIIAPYFSIRPINDAILFNEPDFLMKLTLMMSGGNTRGSGQNPSGSFYITDKIYSLIRGVKSDSLLK